MSSIDGRPGVRQILRRRPDDRALAGVLHGGDGGSQCAPAEQERCRGGDAGGDRQDPAHGVVRRFESEPLAGIHRSDSRVPNCPAMTDTPWQGDACSLVDAFRSGERNPEDELELVLAAVERSALDALCHLDTERARAAAAEADVSLPFGGVPIGVKELDPVEGWPQADGSLVFADRVADHTTTMVRRLERAGVVKVGQTTASEFGGLNVSVTRLHGVTHNPWQTGRTAGGSSGGSCRGRGRRAPADRHRQRRRRVDPHPCGLLRVGGDEGNCWPHPPGSPHRDRTAHRGGRLRRPLGPRRRPLVRRLLGL